MPFGITLRGGEGVRKWTPRMHCQTHTIDQVGMNQAAAAEEVAHVSHFIISVNNDGVLKKQKTKMERSRERRVVFKRESHLLFQSQVLYMMAHLKRI